MKKQLAFLLGAALLLLVGCGGQSERQVPGKVLLVAAAASLEPVVKQLAWSYEAEHRDVKIQLTTGSSGALARQVEQGAAFDLFLSAGEKEMEDLVKENLVEEDTIKKFLANRLVVIVPEGKRTIKGLDQLKNPEYKRVAVAESASVPAGRYAKQALERAGIWQELQPKFVFGNSVRHVLTYVSSENAEAGIVYRSDAISDEKVHIALEIDDKLHDPIRYPMAVLKRSKNSDAARDFLNFLESPKAKEKFAKAAFQVMQ
ncbi:molybdate ABC transporter substrate-binding protein [Effusibacillus lacus]|uniref:Molybdate ABC transporter substrate-binding protein n=1 Tax=Effusibacillus lacus TaxID=1348429 RepID=A0A292YGR9_9BACL|nr:molybdate ABC transporter substrate-binding protein [Effusibacillus lacus]GAX89817.1 molybdate ABC transporter substrate-binding protein [Effusibacillus lacus]